MGKYYDVKKAIKPPKPRKNNMGEKEVKNKQENEMRERKTPKRTQAEIPLRPYEREKRIDAKTSKNNSAEILAKNVNFDPQQDLDKSLLFDLKKASKEQIFDTILEKIPDDGKYYIQHRTNE